MVGSIFLKISKSSFLWGGLASFAFFALINNGVIKDPTIIRYCAMHPIEYAITIMFFVGMAGLCIKFFDVRQLWGRVKAGAVLKPITDEKLECKEAVQLFLEVDANIKKNGEALHVNRLRTILTNIWHANSLEKFDDDLRCLADDDYARAESDYGLTKLIIWAIPILGFLGTVVGIALAMGNLAPEALEESLPQVMQGLTIAFDTTALALAFSMVVYFSQFLLWRDEQKLLDEIAVRVDRELRGRFMASSTEHDDSHLIAVRMMIEVVLETLQDLIQRQADIWDQAISASHSRYAMLASESASQMKVTLVSAMRENVEQHAKALVKAEQELVLQSKQEIKEVATQFERSIAAMNELQKGVLSQSETLRDVINAMGDITKIEERLNQNLASLAESHYFEETLNSLAAAVHLLSSKQTGASEVTPVKITRGKGKGQAA